MFYENPLRQYYINIYHYILTTTYYRKLNLEQHLHEFYSVCSYIRDKKILKISKLSTNIRCE
jgi:hypothetical protein